MAVVRSDLIQIFGSMTWRRTARCATPGSSTAIGVRICIRPGERLSPADRSSMPDMSTNRTGCATSRLHERKPQ